jgi:hypothetical protein
VTAQPRLNSCTQRSYRHNVEKTARGASWIVARHFRHGAIRTQGPSVHSEPELHAPDHLVPSPRHRSAAAAQFHQCINPKITVCSGCARNLESTTDNGLLLCNVERRRVHHLPPTILIRAPFRHSSGLVSVPLGAHPPPSAVGQQLSEPRFPSSGSVSCSSKGNSVGVNNEEASTEHRAYHLCSKST